jgi:hypothetical protein
MRADKEDIVFPKFDILSAAETFLRFYILRLEVCGIHSGATLFHDKRFRVD